MIGALSNIIFLNPWVLAGAAALPVIWFLLRVMPPAAQRIILPTVRFLKGLVPERKTPSRTPWWILLLRVLIAALVLLALAHPVYNPAQGLGGNGAVRIVIDNDWPSAHNRKQQMERASEIAAQAGREGREIYIHTTAPLQDKETPLAEGAMGSGAALSLIGGLETLPWAADYRAAAKLAEEQNAAHKKEITSFWLGHGVDASRGGMETLARTLAEAGDVHYIEPTGENLPLTLHPTEGTENGPGVKIIAPSSLPRDFPVTVRAFDMKGKILDQQTITPGENAGGALPEITFNIPAPLRSSILEYALQGQYGAGGVYYLDARFQKKNVGIAVPEDETTNAPFLKAGYYLRRALEPYANLSYGDIETLIDQDIAVLILPDAPALPAVVLNSLESWVDDGGLLLRFAGPKMAEGSAPALVPVPLRSGERTLEGTLTWEKPLGLAPFPETSPLYGLPVPDDVTVRQQVLADPSGDLAEKTWASLSDGTPLITAAPRGSGMVVLVHTTASPAWSDLALSGLYVEMLRRIVGMAGKTQNSAARGFKTLAPVWVLDGDGKRTSPSDSALPLSLDVPDKELPSALYPPGLYGREGLQKTINIGDHAGSLEPPSLSDAVKRQYYTASYELDLLPYVLAAAFILLLLDTAAIIMLSDGKRFLRFAGVILLVGGAVLPAQAQEEAFKYADGLYLAYIKSGDPALDALSHTALKNLAEVLKQRTSAESQGVAAIDPETDEMAFFPLIYWPLSAATKNFSEAALLRVQHYLDHGGTILFDTRDAGAGAQSYSNSPQAQKLREITATLNIPPLMRIDKDHVLGRSFYLLDQFPGMYSGAPVWVEKNSAAGRDGVSSVIIGSNDWAGAWASGRGAPGSSPKQHELAMRFGVNVVMYALTGNYKADQVHVPYILERLGQ